VLAHTNDAGGCAEGAAEVSFAEYGLFYRALWQKRPIILFKDNARCVEQDFLTTHFTWYYTHYLLLYKKNVGGQVISRRHCNRWDKDFLTTRIQCYYTHYILLHTNDVNGWFLVSGYMNYPHLYIYIHVYIFIHLNTYKSMIYIYKYNYIYIYTCIYIYTHTHTYKHTHVYLYVYIYTHTHTCTHVHIYFTHTHRYTCIYICSRIYNIYK